jgi:hypothetical protein
VLRFGCITTSVSNRRIGDLPVRCVGAFFRHVGRCIPKVANVGCVVAIRRHPVDERVDGGRRRRVHSVPVSVVQVFTIRQGFLVANVGALTGRRIDGGVDHRGRVDVAHCGFGGFATPE